LWQQLGGTPVKQPSRRWRQLGSDPPEDLRDRSECHRHGVGRRRLHPFTNVCAPDIDCRRGVGTRGYRVAQVLDGISGQLTRVIAQRLHNALLMRRLKLTQLMYSLNPCSGERLAHVDAPNDGNRAGRDGDEFASGINIYSQDASNGAPTPETVETALGCQPLEAAQ